VVGDGGAGGGAARILAWRRGSLRLGAFSFLQWQITALALPGGLLRHRADPRQPLAAVDLSPAWRVPNA
jgi:hypothetical protein